MIKLFALILFLVPSFLFAQQRKAFTITGHSVFYNNQQLGIQGGVLSSYKYNYNDFDFVNSESDTADNSFKLVQVRNEQFTLKGFQKYPHPFQVVYYDAENNTGISSYFFFVDSDSVIIEIINLSPDHRLGNLLNSKSNKEYQQLKKLYSTTADTLTGKIHDLKGKQKIIQKYITQHPNSYVALWDMVFDYAIYLSHKNDDDIKSILKSALLLSPSIKKSTTYQALVKNINEDLKRSVGKTFLDIGLDSIYRNVEMVEDKLFPNIPLNSLDSLIPIIKRNKFTLVDFWFSSCKPCIAQFPSLRITYDQNKSKGFEIIGISIDRDNTYWQKTIQKHNLNWLQYLDSNEIITEKLNVTGFPTNYLLDHDGKIIKKNISPEDLEIFLQKNLNF